MTTHLVTFSDSSMSRSAELCLTSGLSHGCDTAVLKHSFLATAERGCGFWRWKPEIILSRMAEAQDGDILIYADAGIEFIDNINYIIDRADQDIFLFGNMYEHAHWCKRDIVEAIWPLRNDNGSIGATLGATSKEHIEWARFGKQVQASVIFFRVNDKTRAFVKEWLDWCLFEGGRLIDDSPSRLPNHPEFQENRHDQAILTTLAYRDGIPLNWWPAVYNDGAFIYPRGEYKDEGYPALFHHHRGVKTGERTA